MYIAVKVLILHKFTAKKHVLLLTIHHIGYAEA